VSDLADLRRRAAVQSRHGNYWAGKVPHLVDRIARYEETLRHIADGDDCTNYRPPSSCRTNSGRRRDSNEGATRWCDTCIALDALGDQS
jgi:hypothetical protein